MHQEDAKLIGIVEEWAAKNSASRSVRWRSIAERMPGRSGKQCRERWNYSLRPNIKKGGWTESEESLIIQLQKKIGNSWTTIAESLPGRTDNDVKNRWHTLNRKLRNKSTSSVVSKLKLKPSKVPSAMPRKVSALEPIHKPSKVHTLPVMPLREVSVLEPILKTPRRGSISAMHRTQLSIDAFDLSTEAASTLANMKRVQFTPFNLNNHNSRGSFMLSRWTEDYLSMQMTTPSRTSNANTNAFRGIDDGFFSPSYIPGVATATTPYTPSLFALSDRSSCYSGPLLSNTPLHIRHTMSFQGGGGRMTAICFTPIGATPIADRRTSMLSLSSLGMTPNICFTPLPFTKHVSNSGMTPFSMGFTPSFGRQYNMNNTASRCISIGTSASSGSKSEGEEIEAIVDSSSDGFTKSVSMAHTSSATDNDVFTEEANVFMHAV
jgi:hypothetical protein